MQHDRSLSPSVRYQILDVYRNHDRFSNKRWRANDWVNDLQNDPNLSSAVRRNILRIYSEDQKFRRRKLLTINQSKTYQSQTDSRIISPAKRFKTASNSQYGQLIEKETSFELAGNSIVSSPCSSGEEMKKVYCSQATLDNSVNKIMVSKPTGYAKVQLAKGKPIGYINSKRSDRTCNTDVF
jgi:hypothetical protein